MSRNTHWNAEQAGHNSSHPDQYRKPSPFPNIFDPSHPLPEPVAHTPRGRTFSITNAMERDYYASNGRSDNSSSNSSNASTSTYFSNHSSVEFFDRNFQLKTLPFNPFDTPPQKGGKFKPGHNPRYAEALQVQDDHVSPQIAEADYQWNKHLRNLERCHQEKTFEQRAQMYVPSPNQSSFTSEQSSSTPYQPQATFQGHARSAVERNSTGRGEQIQQPRRNPPRKAKENNWRW